MTPLTPIDDVDDPLIYLRNVKSRLKALRRALDEDNTHRAVCHVEIALNHLRLAEYAVEGIYTDE